MSIQNSQSIPTNDGKKFSFLSEWYRVMSSQAESTIDSFMIIDSD